MRMLEFGFQGSGLRYCRFFGAYLWVLHHFAGCYWWLTGFVCEAYDVEFHIR